MKKYIYVNSKRVRYIDKGKGTVVVLIHGFMESVATWKNLIAPLSESCRIIAIDLPGHGKSKFAEQQTIESYSDTIYQVLKNLEITKFVIVGHSMGGYVSLDFAEKHIEMLSGLCLFHSTPFADSAEKKISRLNTIEKLNLGHKDEICLAHASNMFASQNLLLMEQQIEKVYEICMKNTTINLISSLTAMYNRKDYYETFKQLQIPVLYIAGKYDNFISSETIDKIEFPECVKFQMLHNSGHAAMYEQVEESLLVLNDFILNV